MHTHSSHDTRRCTQRAPGPRPFLSPAGSKVASIVIPASAKSAAAVQRKCRTTVPVVARSSVLISSHRGRDPSSHGRACSTG